MSEEKTGIKELKELVAFIVALVQAIADALEDGKIGFFDLFKFLGVLRKVGPAFKNLGALRDEIADLSEAEKEELKKYIDEEFSIPNKEIEGYIEQALEVAISLLDLLPVFSKPKE